MKRSVVLLLLGLLVVPGAPAPHAQQRTSGSSNERSAGAAVLAPTPHPPVPHDLTQLWLAPDRSLGATQSGAVSLGNAARLTAGGDYTKVLGLVNQPAVRRGLLGQYAAY